MPRKKTRIGRRRHKNTLKGSATSKSKKKKSDKKMAFPEKSALPLMETHTTPAVYAQEDWEREIKEVELQNWQMMRFGSQRYGPEDVLHFTLRDLTMERSQTIWTVMPKYIPAMHHTQDIEWVSYKLPPTEPGQFSDVEE